MVDVNNVKATAKKPGYPNKADWPHTPWEFDLTGKLELKLENGPLINHVGNCAIAIAFEEVKKVAWTVIKTVVNTLQEQRLEAPRVPLIGGTSISM